MSDDVHKLRALMGQVIVEAWRSPAFLRSFQADPARELRSRGLAPPPGLRITVHADSERLRHVVARPEWLNPGNTFRERAEREPVAALKSVGFTVAQGVEYRVVFNSPAHMNIVVPVKPGRNECSIERLR